MVQEIAGAPCQTPAGLLFCLKFVGADNDRVDLPPTETSPVLELAGDEFGFGALVFELAKPARVC